MTRINIIPVSELTDQHLIAEYREITMIPVKEKIAMKPNWYRKTPKIPHDRFATDLKNIEAEYLLSLLYI